MTKPKKKIEYTYSAYRFNGEFFASLPQRTFPTFKQATISRLSDLELGMKCHSIRTVLKGGSQ
jgi:hypothetical protein